MVFFHTDIIISTWDADAVNTAVPFKQAPPLFRQRLLATMTLLAQLLTPYTLLLLPVLYYVLPYLRQRSLLSIPGPQTAAFSNLWLMYHSRRGKRFMAVDEAHQRYGTLVRIQPDHVSVADPEAIPIIYGHGNGFMKA